MHCVVDCLDLWFKALRVGWCGVVWCGVVWCGVVWGGVGWGGVGWGGVGWGGVGWGGVPLQKYDDVVYMSICPSTHNLYAYPKYKGNQIKQFVTTICNNEIISNSTLFGL